MGIFELYTSFALASLAFITAILTSDYRIRRHLNLATGISLILAYIVMSIFWFIAVPTLITRKNELVEGISSILEEHNHADH